MSYIASIGRLGKDIWAMPQDDIVIFFHVCSHEFS